MSPLVPCARKHTLNWTPLRMSAAKWNHCVWSKFGQRLSQRNLRWLVLILCPRNAILSDPFPPLLVSSDHVFDPKTFSLQRWQGCTWVPETRQPAQTLSTCCVLGVRPVIWTLSWWSDITQQRQKQLSMEGRKGSSMRDAGSRGPWKGSSMRDAGGRGPWKVTTPWAR